MGLLYKNFALYGCTWTISHITDCWYSQQAKVATHKQVQVQVVIHRQVQVQVAIHKCKCLLATSCHWRIFVCTFYKTWITNKELNTANQTGLYWSLFYNVIDKRSILNLVIFKDYFFTSFTESKLSVIHFDWSPLPKIPALIKNNAVEVDGGGACTIYWILWHFANLTNMKPSDICKFITLCHILSLSLPKTILIEIAAKMYCSGSFVMPRMKIAGIYIHPGSLPSRLPSPWFTLLEYGLRRGGH